MQGADASILVKLLRQVADLPDELRSGAVAIGNFDGVHRGHARIVARLLEQARAVERSGRRLYVRSASGPHPAARTKPRRRSPGPIAKPSCWPQLGVDAVIAYPTDEELLQLSANDFFQHIVRDTLDARAMVEGPNFYFGHGRAGTIDVLAPAHR